MTKTYKICTLRGDGIGPEIMAEGVKVLKALGEKYDVDFACEDALIGGCAIDATGEALPQATLDAANASDAVLLAAVGGPKWDTTDPSKSRPEQGLGLAFERRWACIPTCVPFRFSTHWPRRLP